MNGLSGYTVSGFAVYGLALFAETYQGNLFLSTDLGNSFTSIAANLPRVNAELNYYARTKLFATDTFLFAAGDGIGLWRRPLTEVSIIDNPLPPRSFYLEQNFPNPFNAGTTIQFANPEAGTVSLKVYDLLGQEVAILINNETRLTGYYSLNWDGSGHPSGVYFYRLQTGKVTETRRAVLLR
jgi:hypothetical protein